ncbi:anti-anti-sigma factor [Geodermatophilus siccatus]|uniref:Anti-anti-sigma factor n=1 Tax=Geodermatophilus siccatus TaxID=1137991 RepID=A0A1G9MQL9_9ACTN|nr:MEDS domain-containing protein [Geodermatophilus siccatus]SDL76558.1 anti-anti-sigma factor [Geodermatophilus siccatus]
MWGVDGATTGPEWDGHLMLLHESAAERQAGVAAWVQRGLDLGEKVLYAEGPDEQEGSLITALEAHEVDVPTALRDGRLTLVPLAEFYPAEGQRLVVDRALAEGFPAVRMSVGVLGALTILSPRHHLSVEQRLEELVRSLPVSVLCQYARSSTRGPALRDAIGVHVPGIRETCFRTGESELGLVLQGEVDACNAEVLEAAVTAFTDVPPRVLSLDLAELTFIDAAACRALAQGSRGLRASGGRLLLVAPPPQVERTLCLLGLDDLPGFQVVGESP